MIRADIHIHTCATDGTWDVYELRDELNKKGIKFFSVTDHDDMSNAELMLNVAEKDKNLHMLMGTELTATYDGREYHLTAYGFDKENAELKSLTAWCRQVRLDYNHSYMEKFMVVKYPQLSIEEYDKYEYNLRRGGWKSLNYMLDKGVNKSMAEHFKDIEESGIKIVFKTPEEVIKTAKKANAKIFLAHPSYHYKNNVMPEQELKYWIEEGIDGIECYSPYNGTFAEQYVTFCNKNNLMISGGSDCHGEFTPGRSLGDPVIDLKDLKLGELLEQGGIYGI